MGRKVSATTSTVTSWSLVAAAAVLAATVLAAPSSGVWLLLLGAAALIACTWRAWRAGAMDGTVAAAIIAVSVFAAAADLFTHDGSVGEDELIPTALALGGMLLVLVALRRLLVVRHPESARGVVGDAAIVGLGTWIVTWVLLTQPHLRGGKPRVLTVLAGLHQPIGAVAAFLIGLVLLAMPRRLGASWWIAGAIGCGLISDIMHSLVADGHVDAGGWRTAHAFAVVAFFLGAAGIARPDIELVAKAERVTGRPRAFARLIVTTSSLVVPLVVLALSDPHGRGDKAVRAASAIVLGGAVTLRVVQGVTTARRAQDRLLRTAQTDPLTGLPNRTVLLERIEHHLQESWHGPLRPTLYFVDLDRFKNINDSLGHAAGDQVLRTVAERLVLAVPERAMVARLSGDEYVVLDQTTVDEGSFSLAERLLAVFREPLPLPQGDVFVTASLGIATIDADTRTNAEDLLRHADTAMYRAKDAGRNCVAFYDESMHERVSHRLAVETALYRALDRRELRLYHQPILDLDTGEVVGFEALMRWQQSDGSIVSPAEFIPIAEDTGTIVPIGSWALLEALNQLRRWIDDRVCSPSATMSVNVSPRQLADPAFPSIVSEALMRSGVAPSQVWLEITESVMISEPELAMSTLEKLNALGVMIALDDFGTGYSSLSLLQRFPLQRIKIDRAFVQGVADRASDRSLVRTIIAMGTSLGLDLVAEGVESVHQMQVLRDLGCHKAQGYLISHPVPADAMRSTVTALERLSNSPLLRGRVTTEPRIPT
jgi:diguanylate cyclase (GGDEF)-like protein